MENYEKLWKSMKNQWKTRKTKINYEKLKKNNEKQRKNKENYEKLRKTNEN